MPDGTLVVLGFVEGDSGLRCHRSEEDLAGSEVDDLFWATRMVEGDGTQKEDRLDAGFRLSASGGAGRVVGVGPPARVGVSQVWLWQQSES